MTLVASFYIYKSI